MNLKRQDLEQYISRNYKSDRMVLVGAGSVNHDELVKLAEKKFGGLKMSNPPISTLTKSEKPPRFWGSEVRVMNDDMDQAHIALAVEGVGWSDPDYYTMLTLQSIVGNWDRSLGSTGSMSSRLSHTVAKHNLANQFMSFNTSYTDTGLWGTYLVSENVTQLDDLVHFTLKEWSRLCTSVSAAEVERAKQQLKTSLLLNLDGSTAVAEDIGRQMLTLGKRMEPSEVAAAVDRVTVKDVHRVASEKIWDNEIAVVGVGPVNGLPDYNRVRSSMSFMRS